MKDSYNIAVAGTGYVGLSLAVLLAQHNHVTAVDIIPEKVEMLNNRQSPIADKEIEDYLQNKVFSGMNKKTADPDPADEAGFDLYMKRFVACLPAQKAAAEHFRS